MISITSSIWHTKKEKPMEDKTVFAQHKSVLRGVDWFIWEPQEFTDAIRADVIAWCYLDDLLALETELERTRKALGLALDWLREVATPEKCDDDLCREFTKRKLAEIENITKGSDNE